MSAQHHGAHLCNQHLWPWSFMTSGTAVEVITPSSSMRNAGSELGISFLLPLPEFGPVKRWCHFEAIPSPGPPSLATYCLILEETLLSRLQQVPHSAAHRSFLCSAAAPFPKAEVVFHSFPGHTFSTIGNGQLHSNLSWGLFPQPLPAFSRPLLLSPP